VNLNVHWERCCSRISLSHNAGEQNAIRASFPFATVRRALLRCAGLCRLTWRYCKRDPVANAVPSCDRTGWLIPYTWVGGCCFQYWTCRRFSRSRLVQHQEGRCCDSAVELGTVRSRSYIICTGEKHFAHICFANFVLLSTAIFCVCWCNSTSGRGLTWLHHCSTVHHGIRHIKFGRVSWLCRRQVPSCREDAEARSTNSPSGTSSLLVLYWVSSMSMHSVAAHTTSPLTLGVCLHVCV
jgi:hypothetical protein